MTNVEKELLDALDSFYASQLQHIKVLESITNKHLIDFYKITKETKEALDNMEEILNSKEEK